jgi:hypothetical protein
MSFLAQMIVSASNVKRLVTLSVIKWTGRDFINILREYFI